jgi:hypothetical protein
VPVVVVVMAAMEVMVARLQLAERILVLVVVGLAMEVVLMDFEVGPPYVEEFVAVVVVEAVGEFELVVWSVLVVVAVVRIAFEFVVVEVLEFVGLLALVGKLVVVIGVEEVG